MVQYPEFAKLAPLFLFLEQYPKNKSRRESLERAANIGLLPMNQDMISQAQSTLAEKLDLMSAGGFRDSTKLFDSLSLRAKNYIFDDSTTSTGRPATDSQRMKTLDFLLDFMIIASTWEYPLVGSYPGFQARKAAKTACLVAVTYATNEAISIFGLDEKKKCSPGDPRCFVTQFGNKLVREVKDAESDGALGNIAAMYLVDGRLAALRNHLDTVANMASKFERHRKDHFYRRAGSTLKRADALNLIAQQSELLAHLYNEFLLATVRGYSSRFSGIFKAKARNSERQITTMLDILSSAFSSIKFKGMGLQLLEGDEAFISHARTFAYAKPGFITKRRDRYMEVAQYVCIPHTAFSSNMITYPTTVVSYLRKNGFENDSGDVEPTMNNGYRYMAMVQKHSNVFFTCYVDLVPTKNISRGREPDIAEGFFMPMRYCVFSGSSPRVVAEAEKFGNYLQEIKIAASLMDRKELHRILRETYGLGESQIQNLRRITALSRASPIFDRLADMVTTCPDIYGKRIS